MSLEEAEEALREKRQMESGDEEEDECKFPRFLEGKRTLDTNVCIYILDFATF